MNCIFAIHIYRNISIQKNCQPVQNPLILYCPHAYPPPILSHPMHALPLFCPTPCMPSPYSVPLMHILPLFYPAHACPSPILSQPIHTLPLFYSSPYMSLPYSVPLHACPLLFSTSPHMPPQYSIPAHACPPNSLSHERGRHVSPLTSENASFESAHTEYIIIIYLA